MKKDKQQIKIPIDTTYIDAAIKKADELSTKLQRCIELIHQLSKLSK